MIKLSLKLPSGIEIAYEGPEDALNGVLASLSGDLQTTLETLGTVAGKPKATPQPTTTEAPTSGQGEDSETTPLDPRAIAESFERVGANTDIERLTVVAQASVEAGRDGLDYETLDQMYRELGLRRPRKWRPTFSNARNRGYIKNAARGLWQPTVLGENFALLGERAPARKRATPRTSNGGEGD